MRLRPDANRRAVSVLLPELETAEAVTVSTDDETGSFSLDMTPLLIRIGTIQVYLMAELARRRGVSEEAMRLDLRKFLDSLDD